MELPRELSGEEGRKEASMDIGANYVRVRVRVGGSAAAAGELVKQLGGELVEYIFILELDFLKGREKLSAPVYTLLNGQEEGGLGVGERS